MKNLFLLCLSCVWVFGCDNENCSVASCLAPPNGDFTSEKYNIAFYENISDGSDQIRIDSIILSADEDIIIKDFYTWIILENPDQVSSFKVFSGENQYIINEVLPVINGNLKGYLIGFVKDGDSLLINGAQASEDLINGVCNDTINC